MEVQDDDPQKPYSPYFRYIKRHKEEHKEYLATLTPAARRRNISEAWRNISDANKKQLEAQYAAEVVAYNAKIAPKK
jgi:hypothetical protein